jgi:hypothetical protein
MDESFVYRFNFTLMGWEISYFVEARGIHNSEAILFRRTYNTYRTQYS